MACVCVCVCVCRCMSGTKFVCMWCARSVRMCGARSVRMCGANLQAFSSVLKSVLQMQSLYRELLRAVRT